MGEDERCDANEKESVGMYYTPKELLDSQTIQCETGGFLLRVYEWLIKGLTVNPPYEVKGK